MCFVHHVAVNHSDHVAEREGERKVITDEGEREDH